MGCCRGDSGVGSREVRILLDTNFILLIADGIDFFSLIEEELGLKPKYIVLNSVVGELLNIAKQTPLMAKKVDFVLRIVRERCLFDNSITGSGDTDEDLIRHALASKAAVATNDKELRKKLRKLGIPEIYLREESKRIGIEGLVV